MVSGILPIFGRGTCCRAALLLAALVLPCAALAQPTAAATGPVITTYDLNSGYTNPDGITEGPDGNMWFTEFSDTFTVGEITPSGTITDHPVAGPGDSAAGGITLSPGQRDLLYTVPAPDGYLGRITTTGTARGLPLRRQPAERHCRPPPQHLVHHRHREPAGWYYRADLPAGEGHHLDRPGLSAAPTGY